MGKTLTVLAMIGMAFTSVARAQDIEVNRDNFLELNEEMKAFLDEHVANSHSSRQRLNSLVYSIFGENGLGLVYGNAKTKTPIETFESGNGNCMSFTTMFIAMARHVGMKAHFQEVEDFPTWDKRGDLVMNNKHMNAMVIVDGRWIEIDFLPFQKKQRRVTRRINDDKALAHFYNNRGAEAMSLGEDDLARRYFEKAIKTVPDFSRAWSNLGVYWRVHNDFEMAEECYRKAIDRDRFAYTAMSNLVHLFEITGRTREATRYEHKVEHYRKKNPYHHFGIASRALDQGDLDVALKELKKAIHLRPREVEFHHTIARVYYELGNMRKVERHLRSAEQFALTPEEKAMYTSKLDMIAKR